jgi:hypothetical protein
MSHQPKPADAPDVVLGQLAAGPACVLYGDAVVLASMLMPVMGAAVVLAWRPITRL